MKKNQSSSRQPCWFVISFIIESQVFCLAIFIYMFSLCINKTMIYFKFCFFIVTAEKQGK